MIKTAQDAYIAGRQAAMEKLANPMTDISMYADDMRASDGGSLDNLGLALGGTALAYQGLQSKAINRALRAANIQAGIGLSNLGLTKLPQSAVSLHGKLRDLHKYRALSALKAAPLKSLAGLGAVGLGTYGAYKGISSLLGDD